MAYEASKTACSKLGQEATAAYLASKTAYDKYIEVNDLYKTALMFSLDLATKYESALLADHYAKRN